MATKLIKDHLFKNGFNFGRVTPSEDVARLLKSLSPRKTDVPLIRIGDPGDGGYLVPDDLQEIRCCFSPGVYQVATFEQHLLDRGIPCYLADRTVDAAPIKHDMIDFEKKHLGVVNDDDQMTLSSWVGRHAGGDDPRDLMLQMDIERAEYTVLLDTPASVLERFRIIVIEFHDLDKLFDRTVFRFYDSVFSKLLSWFHVVHLHPNNVSPPVGRDGLEVPRVMEATFYRKDRAAVSGHADQFPHPLDADNVPGRPSLVLPACWIGG